MNKKKDTSKSTIAKVLTYIKQYRFLLLCSVLLAFASVLLSLYIPVVVGEAIDKIVGPGEVDRTILTLLVRIVVIAVFTAFCQWIMNTINNKITYQVVQDIRNEAFEKIQKIPLKYIDGQSHGDIVSRVIADVDQFADGLLMGFTQLFTGVVTILATLVFMFSINIWIALVVVLLTPLSLFVARFISKKTYHLFLKQSETRGEQTSLVEELVGNQEVVKAYHHEKEAMEQFDEINDRLADCSLQATFFSSLTNPVTRFVNSVV